MIAGQRIRKPIKKEFVINTEQDRGYYSSFGYKSASVATSEGRGYSRAAGDWHAMYDRSRLIDQSRDFARNNGLYKGMINRAVSYIIANGFTLQFKTKSPTYNVKAEKMWREFWRKPEIRGMLSGKQLERMAMSEVLVTGDVGLLKTDKGLLQLFEAEQIDNGSKNKTGIETDSVGKPTKYHVKGYRSNGMLSTSATPIDADNFLFIADRERPSSTRGVPPCQSAFPMLHRINDVCDSEAIAWQLLSRMALSITRQQGPEEAYAQSVADSDLENNTTGRQDLRITEFGAALLFHANPGDKIEGIERNIPGKDFAASLQMFLRLLGLPIGLPLEILLLDWTKSNYSQSRAVLMQAYETFLYWQYLMEDFFYDPILEWKLAEWKGSDLPTRPTDDDWEWIKPTFPWLDQLKEAQACGAQLDRGFNTHAAVCKSLGKDREDVVSARELEVRDAIERAKRIMDDTGEAVPWQIFAGLEAVKSAPVSSEPLPEEKQNGDKKDE